MQHFSAKHILERQEKVDTKHRVQLSVTKNIIHKIACRIYKIACRIFKID